MNGRDVMPACARIAAVDPDLADRMWNTVTDPDGRDLIDERMRGKGRMLCAACPMRLDCISRALVNGWKDKAVYGGLDYASRWILARLIARDLHIDMSGLHRITPHRIRVFLVKSVFRVSSLIFFGFRHEECRPVVCFTGCPSCRT